MTRLHLAVALDLAGELAAERWVERVGEAEAGLLDLVTLEDDLATPEGGPGHLDAVLLAARLAPTTAYIGLVPSVVTTHTEPFHVSTTLATVDFVSGGRVGVQLQVAADPAVNRSFGRRADLGGLHDEAADHVEVQRRLWDSWEDDAEIRDVATGRFVDVDRLHYVDFAGPRFSVRGPSITPRPPQGQLPVVVAVRDDASFGLALGSADVAVLEPALVDRVAELRAGAPSVVLLDRPADLDPDRLVAEAARTGADGFRLWPERLEDVTRELVPALQARGAFRTAYAERTLRERLGLVRPPSRYAEGAAS